MKKQFFDFTQDEKITLTKDELMDLIWSAELRGASTALHEALEHSHESGITRLRDMKQEVRHAQQLLEVADADTVH